MAPIKNYLCMCWYYEW